MTGREVQNLEPEDMPRAYELALEDNERFGTDFLLPRVFDDTDRPLPNYPLALKVIDRGRIAQVHIFERQAELMTFGQNPRGTALSLPALAGAEMILKKLGYSGFHGLVPLSRVAQWYEAMGQRLNMQRDDARVAHFYRTFREG